MNTPMVDRWSSFVPPFRLPNKFDLGSVEKLNSVKGGGVWKRGGADLYEVVGRFEGWKLEKERYWHAKSPLYKFRNFWATAG